MEINKLNNIQNVQTDPVVKKETIKETGLKNDTFSKSEESFNVKDADDYLSSLKDRFGRNKFNGEYSRSEILCKVEKEPAKWASIKQLAALNNIDSNFLNKCVDYDNKALARMTEFAVIKNKDGYEKFDTSNLKEIVAGDDDFYKNAKVLANTDLEAENIIKAAKQKDLDCEKLAQRVNELSDFAGGSTEKVVFAKDSYSKGDYTITAIKSNDSTVKVILDNNMNKYALEQLDYTTSNGRNIAIRKSNDYRNNTTSKIRYSLDLSGKIRPTHEVRIVKDKNGKIQKTEYTSPSEVKGIMNVTYQYPDGRTETISSGTVDKKTGITTIKKNMTSPLGTKTEYLFEDDPQGNRLSDYKITDKNGKVLLQNSETFEVIDENKFISSKNGKKYEITADNDKVTVTDMDNPERTAAFKRGSDIVGNQDEIIKVLKKMPGEELLKLKENVNELDGTKDVINSYTITGKAKNRIYSGDNLYIVLHELGHALDVKDVDLSNVQSTIKNAIFEDEQFNKLYEKEKEAFNKAFPDAQRNHIEYFINHENHSSGEVGARKETIAESNALLTTPIPHALLAMRAQYLQQNFPETIAYLNDKLNEGKQDTSK